jgi:hypothetical protein
MPEVGKRAPFELLAFTAAPVAGALVVVALEGRFTGAQGGRFARQPMLVVDSGDDRPRLELAPVRATLADGRWRSAYAIPAETFPNARFALGLRGTLLELPAPDEPDDTDRLTALAREANALRRALEVAESEAAATSAELGAAVIAARDGALAESTDRIAALEAELAAAAASVAAAEHRAAMEREQALAQAAARVEAAKHRGATEREAAHAEHEQALAAVAARADAAAQDATAARAALAEATVRADAAEQDAATVRAAIAGTEVLRAELAEERERSTAAITELEAELASARRRADALRNAAEADARAARPDDDDATRPLATKATTFGDDDTTQPLAAEPADDDDATRPFARHAAADGDDATQPLAAEPAAADDDHATRPVTLSSRRARARVVGPDAPPASTHTIAPRGLGPWIAVGALVLFAFVLLGLLAGFLA